MNKPKQPPDFPTRFNNAKSRFTLGQISKLGDLLDIVGIPDAGHDRATPLSYTLINELKEKYKNGIPAREQWTVDSLTRQDAKSMKDLGRPLYHYHLDVPYPEPIEDLKVSDIHALVASLLPAPNPKQTAKLLYFQRNCAEEAWLKIKREHVRALLLRVNTGDGKTYAAGQLIRWLIDSNYFATHLSPFKVLYVTKASVVEQTKRVLRDEFGLDLINDISVTNYEALRSHLGEQYLRYEERVEQGERMGKWVWRAIYPLVVMWDECQGLKNEDSEQSKIGQAFNDIDDPNILQLFLSATPFSRVTHAKVFAVACRPKYLGKPLTNITWNAFAWDIAGGDPKEYSKAYIHRLVRELHANILGFRNVKRKHKAINHTELIEFENQEDAETYIKAWDEYLKKKREIENKDLSNSRFLILVQLGVFRQKAELLRARILANRMWKETLLGKACLAACCYKPTIAKAVNYLHMDYGISRNQISLIWGGDAAFTAKTAPKYSWEDICAIQARALNGEEFPKKVWRDIIKQMEYAQAGLGDMPKELDLGVQSREKRQEEIDKFQSGQSLFCFFTFQAGGAGLSLHHSKPELRPRRTFATPTYNEMEMLQALGRAPRITSLSDTEQSILLFKGTIEQDVLAIYKGKKGCLDVVIDYAEREGTKWEGEVRELVKLAGGGETDDESENEMTETDYEEIEEL